MRKFSSETEKLEFIKLAVDAITDNNALQELKMLLKGMELNK